MLNKLLIALTSAAIVSPAVACDLEVASAWIREAPSSATALGGFAVLSNTGKMTLKIQTVTAAEFGAIETHESITENGMAKMRPITVEIPAKGKVEFAPGGKHFMLLSPKKLMKKGDLVTLLIRDSTGCITSAAFTVSDKSPTAASVPMSMDHAAMKHE